MSICTTDRKAQPPAAPDRDANPVVSWLHGLAAMGDEQWHEAIPRPTRQTEQNLGYIQYTAVPGIIFPGPH